MKNYSNMKASATKVIKVNWDDNYEICGESGLPEMVEVPADLAEEEVTNWLTGTYGFSVNYWEEI